MAHRAAATVSSEEMVGGGDSGRNSGLEELGVGGRDGSEVGGAAQEVDQHRCERGS